MAVVRALLNQLLYFPDRRVVATPADAGLDFVDVAIAAADGVAIHGWWVPARGPAAAHVLLHHGNAGNIGDRILHAALLTAVGLDVLLFDYRGYGRSEGRPGEEGTYADARGAREALLARPEVDPARVVYLGESLGGGVAVELALAHPPAALMLLSTFTGVRDLARLHYGFLPPAAVPDAYPSLRRISALACPVLVTHGDRDDIVPLSHGEALFAAAPAPKQIRIFTGAGHNDLLASAGPEWARCVARWLGELGLGSPGGE